MALIDDDLDLTAKQQVIDEQLMLWYNTLFLHDLRLRAARAVEDESSEIDKLTLAITHCQQKITFFSNERSALDGEASPLNGDIPLAIQRQLVDQEIVRWQKERYRAGLQHAASQYVHESEQARIALREVARCEGYLRFLQSIAFVD